MEGSDQTGIKKEIDHRVGPLKVDTKAWQQALTLSRLQVSQNDQESPKMFKYEAPLNSIISQASENSESDEAPKGPFIMKKYSQKQNTVNAGQAPLGNITQGGSSKNSLTISHRDDVQKPNYSFKDRNGSYQQGRSNSITATTANTQVKQTSGMPSRRSLDFTNAPSRKSSKARNGPKADISIRDLTDLSKFRAEIEAIEEQVFKEGYESPSKHSNKRGKKPGSTETVTREEFIGQLFRKYSRNSSPSSIQKKGKKQQSVGNNDLEILAKLLKTTPSHLRAQESPKQQAHQKASVVDKPKITLNSMENAMAKIDLLMSSNGKAVQVPDQLNRKNMFHMTFIPQHKPYIERFDKKSASIAEVDSFSAAEKQFLHLDLAATNSQQKKASAVSATEVLSKKKDWFGTFISNFGFSNKDDGKLKDVVSSIVIEEPSSPNEAEEEEKNLPILGVQEQTTKIETSQDFYKAKKVEETQEMRLRTFSTSIKGLKDFSRLRITKTNNRSHSEIHLPRPDLSPFSDSKNPDWRSTQQKSKFIYKILWQQHLV